MQESEQEREQGLREEKEKKRAKDWETASLWCNARRSEWVEKRRFHIWLQMFGYKYDYSV